jgi:hypothetical protein
VATVAFILPQARQAACQSFEGFLFGESIMGTEHIRIWLDLEAAMLKHRKYQRAWRVYRVLQGLNRGTPWPNGKLNLEQAIADAAEMLDLAPRTVELVIMSDRGRVFWHVGVEHVYLIGYRKVARRFGVSRISKEAVDVPVEKIRGNSQVGLFVAAALYWMQYGNPGTHVTRQKLVQELGVSRKSLAAYARAGWLEIVPVFHIEGELFKRIAPHIIACRKRPDRPRRYNERILSNGDANEMWRWLAEQHANVYTSCFAKPEWGSIPVDGGFRAVIMSKPLPGGPQLFDATPVVQSVAGDVVKGWIPGFAKQQAGAGGPQLFN